MIIGLTATLTQPLPTHDHELHEFIVCMSDTGELQVPGQEYRYKTGCTLFIPGRVAHGIMASEKKPAVSTFACFDWQSCSEHLHDSLKPLIKRLTSGVSAACNYDEAAVRDNLLLADRLHAELQKQDSYSQSMAGSVLTQLMVNHIRDLGLQTESESSSAEQKIARSIEWIENNLNREINVDDMARRAQMSRSLFSRNFRAYTGMSLIAFTMAARADRAARLLSRTDDNIANIALACGFRNIGHFHKTFKTRFRMTPRQYRQTTIKQGSFGQPR
jgi:AraC-like DNA-binding protein